MKAVQRLPTQNGRGLARFDRNVETHRQARPYGTHLGNMTKGRSPKGIGAQSVPCYVRIVGMGEKLRPKAICKTVMLESRPPACG